MFDYRTPNLNSGFIYILSNKSMPGIFKVGMTTNSVKQRIKELNTTEIPHTFKPEKIFEIPEQCLRMVEGQAHRALKKQKFHHGKEFFKCSLEDCVTAIEDAIFDIVKTEAIELVGEAKERKEREAAIKKAEAIRIESERKRRADIQDELNKFNNRINDQRANYVMELKISRDKNTPIIEKYFYTPINVLGIIFVFVLVAVTFGPIAWFGVPFALWWYWNHSVDEDAEDRKKEAEKKFPLVTFDGLTPQRLTEIIRENESVYRQTNANGENSHSITIYKDKMTGHENINEIQKYDPTAQKITCPTCKNTGLYTHNSSGYKCKKCKNIFLY